MSHDLEPFHLDTLIETWSDALRQTGPAAARVTATHEAQKCAERGYDEREARDVLAARGYDARLTREVVAQVYAPDEATLANPDGGTYADRAARRAAQQTLVPVVPTGYSDVVPVIESSLRHYGPQEFVDRLTCGAGAILRLSDQNYKGLVRLARQATEDPARFLSALHEEIAPAIERAILESVRIKESMDAQGQGIRLSHVGDATFEVTGRRIATAHVEMDHGAGCDCARYTTGCFGDFGVPCEHHVYVKMQLARTTPLLRPVHLAPATH